MIHVVIQRKEKFIININVSGHAQSAEYGKDLVCAGVSSACVGIANMLVKKQFVNGLGTIDLKEGFVDIKVNQLNEDVQVVLETLETILETIEESYSDYIKIMKMEV